MKCFAVWRQSFLLSDASHSNENNGTFWPRKIHANIVNPSPVIFSKYNLRKNTIIFLVDVRMFHFWMRILFFWLHYSFIFDCECGFFPALLTGTITRWDKSFSDKKFFEDEKIMSGKLFVRKILVRKKNLSENFSSEKILSEKIIVRKNYCPKSTVLELTNS